MYRGLRISGVGSGIVGVGHLKSETMTQPHSGKNYQNFLLNHGLKCAKFVR